MREKLLEKYVRLFSAVSDNLNVLFLMNREIFSEHKMGNLSLINSEIRDLINMQNATEMFIAYAESDENGLIQEIIEGDHERFLEAKKNGS